MNVDHPTAFWSALAWTLAAAVLFFVPGELIPIPERDATSHMVHIVAFAGGTYLWAHAFPERRVWVGLVGLALIGGSEAVQALVVPGRGAQWLDAGADVVGLVLGLILAVATQQVFGARRGASS